MIDRPLFLRRWFSGYITRKLLDYSLLFQIRRAVSIRIEMWFYSNVETRSTGTDFPLYQFRHVLWKTLYFLPGKFKIVRNHKCLRCRSIFSYSYSPVTLSIRGAYENRIKSWFKIASIVFGDGPPLNRTRVRRWTKPIYLSYRGVFERIYCTFYLHSICRPSEYLCGTGNCVAQDKYCDGENDCGDNSDEPKYCTRESFIRPVSFDSWPPFRPSNFNSIKIPISLRYAVTSTPMIKRRFQEYTTNLETYRLKNTFRDRLFAKMEDLKFSLNPFAVDSKDALPRIRREIEEKDCPMWILKYEMYDIIIRIWS